mmetsp:Transcript_4956/g.11661  ORF Transcript_4956/g.11661 Transcript_4956/m.11661 type:complete len:170 (+) Transcript_4956:271-780(+)|eukprot:CAMPEP_0172614552 /NCGR_PEP_ID=MMETSP1068-20121228/52491_1 /TAXON_ID=35684 /ORGANISM="Pseudopedinella elastica, Strain CCMP716" /LENGTH=169 /DNA_ID=CAMNT_0013419383 /DNA_START=271 /DNA_END=780 /DNA_ORIENTATION=-
MAMNGNTTNGGAAAPVAFKLSKVNYKDLKFIIMDRPTDENLPSYLRELKKEGVTAIVRVCEPSYNTSEAEKAGISMHELAFDDGTPPPRQVISKWRSVVKSATGAVAIHCVAGLGRAPVMVAIALIDKGLDSVAAVELIRKERRGAINKKQLDFLRAYTPQPANCCQIS